MNTKYPIRLLRFSPPRACAWMLFLAAAGAAAHAGEPRYPVGDIPRDLRGEFDAVIREHATVFEVRDRRRARLTETIAVTVFDADGRQHGELAVPYSTRFEKVTSLEGWIYDGKGDLVRELGDGDVHDFSAISDYSLFEDSREKTAELYYDSYPYTVVYRYEERYDGILSWPEWAAQWEKDPVQRTTFEIRIPESDSLRYWTNADSVKPAVSLQDGKKVFLWKAENLPGVAPETMSEDRENRTACVLPAPSEFQLEEHPGIMSTWKEFGLWIESLWAGRDQLPEPVVREVRALLRPGDPPREVIRKLYVYMQSRTRYVSVQLGIGGWQPFEASYVQEKGYGDCKALSNYTIALLKSAGLEAYPVLIHGGRRFGLYREDFPRNQFNHVIVCVPLAGDSVWLECTSQHAPPGHLGDFTEARFGLMLTPAGGKIVHTPVSTPSRNVQLRTGHVSLAIGGTAQAEIDVRYTGDQCDYMREVLTSTPAGDREKWILKDMNVQNATLRRARIQGLEARDSAMAISTALALPQYGSVTGSRCFFVPNMLNRRTRLLPDMPARRSPLRFDYPYRDIDSITYRISPLYACEAIPKEQCFECGAAGFRSKTVQADDSTIVYTRAMEIRGTEFPPAQYSEYRKFIADVATADRAQVVLVRKKP